MKTKETIVFFLNIFYSDIDDDFLESGHGNKYPKKEFDENEEDDFYGDDVDCVDDDFVFEDTDIIKNKKSEPIESKTVKEVEEKNNVKDQKKNKQTNVTTAKVAVNTSDKKFSKIPLQVNTTNSVTTTDSTGATKTEVKKKIGLASLFDDNVKVSNTTTKKKAVNNKKNNKK